MYKAGDQRHRRSGKNQVQSDLRSIMSKSSEVQQETKRVASRVLDSPIVSHGYESAKFSTRPGVRNSSYSRSSLASNLRANCSLSSSSSSNVGAYNWRNAGGLNRAQVEMERALQRWGVNPALGRQHLDFWRQHIEYVDQVRNGSIVQELVQPGNRLELLSEDPLMAMKQVFTQEIRALHRPKGLVVVIDSLSPDKHYSSTSSPLYCSAPYTYDRQLRQLVLRPEFRSISGAWRLDPFHRFTFERVPTKPHLRKQYVDGNSKAAAFRAIVAHSACHHPETKCVNCNKKSIRWNGYGPRVEFRKWKKLVCSECGSVYEIKSKATEKMIWDGFEGMMYGGSYYDAYFAVKKELPFGAKQFIAVVSEEKTLNGGRWTWPVFVAEVEQVNPALQARSFYSGDRKKVWSRMSFKAGTCNLWFYVPVYKYDAVAIATSVIDDLEDYD